MSLKTSSILATLSLLNTVRAHGIVTGVVADGVYFQGYNPSFQYQRDPPKVAGWTAPLTQDRGFVDGSGYNSPDIICHKGATPGQAYIQVSAGGTIDLQWTKWPESHHGPMLDYLAPCNGDCTTVDKESLQWTKIDEAGLNKGDPAPGDWASDDMIRNNNTWRTTIPSSIAPGKYVLRHETIALHASHETNGAQNYPQCMNLEITGSGTDTLSSGTLGTDLYSPDDAGIFLNIYYPPLKSYDIPGPEVMAGGSNSQPAPSASPSDSDSDISVTATPTTNIAIPTGEPSSPSSPPYPIPDNSTTTHSAWEDWSTTTAAVEVTTTVETKINIPTDAPKPPADIPSPDTGSDDDSSPPPPPSGGSPPSDPPSGPPPVGGGKEDETPSPDTTSSPTSFSSTVTGRIGKPTKFVCYVEE
jgi:lytic cellulose monooxygenase (C1-hydroxylating)